MIHGHVMSSAAVDGIAGSGINPWRLAETVETWGLSNFPRWGNPFIYCVSKIELTRCQAERSPGRSRNETQVLNGRSPRAVAIICS